MKNLRNNIASFYALARLLLMALVVSTGAAITVTPAVAQDDDEPSRGSKTLDPAVAKVLQEVFLAMQEDRWQAALGQLNQLISSRGDRMKPFDKATTYELRGSVKVNLEDYQGGLRDFQTALNTNALPTTRNNQLRYFIAQLYFQLENYAAAISGLNEWIRSANAAGIPVDANAYYLLAAAYVQTDKFPAATRPAEQAVSARTEPKKNDHDLLNLIYSETNATAKRGALLEKMINLWPGDRTYWTQLSGLYSNSGKDKDAFSVLEVAYRAGLLEKEAEILTLAQYYSFFDNPYRGAKLLEREMEAGVVKRNQRNLTLLSQLWSQSREHKRAIPVLRSAAGQAPNGELYYRLGQVLLADEQYRKSEQALVSALNKGGMNSKKTGDAWLLLGTARFSQAGPDDRPQRQKSREAFVRARNYSDSAGQASDWVRYIDAIEDTIERQDKLERQQKLEALKDEIERLRTQAQVCRLRGGAQAECDAIIKRAQDLKAAGVDGVPDAPEPETPAAPNAETEEEPDEDAGDGADGGAEEEGGDDAAAGEGGGSL